MNDYMRQRLGDVLKHFAFDRKDDAKEALHDVLTMKGQEIINKIKPIDDYIPSDDIDIDES